MNHSRATTHEILGHYRPCIFKERFRYDPCRSCTGDRLCENYLPVKEQKKNEPVNFRDSEYVPMILRQNSAVISNTQKVLEWMRRVD